MIPTTTEKITKTTKMATRIRVTTTITTTAMIMATMKRMGEWQCNGNRMPMHDLNSYIGEVMILLRCILNANDHAKLA